MIKNTNIPLLSDNENYTVFIPTSDALTAYGADTLTGARLVNFLKLYFRTGQILFLPMGMQLPGFMKPHVLMKNRPPILRYLLKSILTRNTI